MTDLMLAYHRRSDHGRDGVELDGFTCNCRELFEEYARSLLASAEQSPWAHPDTMIGKR